MILAAGRGERLQPLTKAIPKALCPVKGRPLIAYHLEALALAGFERVVVNHAYLGGKIRHFLGNGTAWGLEIVYSPEPSGGLETGGGVVQALELLGEKPFLTVNADIYTDYPLKPVQLSEGCLAHLVLVPAEAELGHFGDFGLIDGHWLSNQDKQYTFAGIACYHPDFFKGQRVGRYSLTPLLRKAVDQRLLSAEVYQGRWSDIGSLSRLERVEGWG